MEIEEVRQLQPETLTPEEAEAILPEVLKVFEAMYQAGRWPVGIYPAWLRMILTFIVPVAFAVTAPAEALTARLTVQTLILAFVVAAFTLIASRLFWKFGLRNYTGASA